MGWEVFSWHSVDPIAKISEKINRYQYLGILKHKVKP